MAGRAAVLQQQLVRTPPPAAAVLDQPRRSIEIDLTWPAVRQALAGVYNRLGSHIERLALDVDIDVPAVLAVWYVESGGRVHEPGQAVIRFENHVLFDLWGRQVPTAYDQHFQHGGRAPALGAACRGPGGGFASWNCHAYRRDVDGGFSPCHLGQAQEYDVLDLARALTGDDVALQCISMGGPQIMGFHFARLGYESPREMFDAFQAAESAQVAGFFDFCRQAGAPDEAFSSIRRHDWANFARLYNGSGNVATYAALLSSAHGHAQAIMPLVATEPATPDEFITQVLSCARALLGVPYEINLPGTPRVPGGRGWGKKYPDLDKGLDCSGYVLNVLQQLGELAWLDPDFTDCDVLWRNCEPVTRTDSRPGDLVFFTGTYNTAGFSHIGFVTEPGGAAMISARVPKVGEDSLTSGYFQSRVAGFGRPRRGGGP